MTGYLIDTNVISEFRKGSRADAGVRSWFEDHSEDRIWLSVLVLAELHRGAQLIRRRDTTAAERLDNWLATLELGYSDRILPITRDVAHQWARIGTPDPLSVIDGLLAATAMVNGLTLVTRNVADVDRSGVAWENPFHQ